MYVVTLYGQGVEGNVVALLVLSNISQNGVFELLVVNKPELGVSGA